MKILLWWQTAYYMSEPAAPLMKTPNAFSCHNILHDTSIRLQTASDWKLLYPDQLTVKFDEGANGL